MSVNTSARKRQMIKRQLNGRKTGKQKWYTNKDGKRLRLYVLRK